MKVLGTVVVMGIAAVASLVMSASAGATPHCHGLTATMTGTSGSDNIVGTNHRDVIVARAGHDIVRSRGGRDVICAGRGDDEVAAGARHDRVYGGRGMMTFAEAMAQIVSSASVDLTGSSVAGGTTS